MSAREWCVWTRRRLPRAEWRVDSRYLVREKAEAWAEAKRRQGFEAKVVGP